MSAGKGPVKAKELRWLANEFDKWRVPVDGAVLLRQSEFFPVLVDIIERHQLSARQRANALRLLNVMCGQGGIERNEVLPQLRSLLSPAEAHDLLAQGEALGLSEPVLSTVRAWLAEAL